MQDHAGLEAARVAAAEGHNVEIYEKTNMIGWTIKCCCDTKI